MPTFENADFGLKFTTPDRLNVRQALAYDSKRLEMGGQPAFVVLWECARLLIDSWECERMPDRDVDLETLEDPALARLIEFVGVAVSAWRRSLDAVPKN